MIVKFAAGAVNVPLVIVRPPVSVVAPLNVKPEVELFSIRLVIFIPRRVPVIVSVPAPVPEFVTVPILSITPVENVTPFAVELLLFTIKFPTPVTPPETVITAVPEAFVKVVPPLATVIGLVLMVNAEDVVFKLTAVTFVPIPPEIVVSPVPAPIFVTVPALLIGILENVIVPVPPSSSIVKLFVPVTPPEKVAVIPTPLLPIVSIGLFEFVARTIGFANVRPLETASKDAAALPVVSPIVIVELFAPKALLLV